MLEKCKQLGRYICDAYSREIPEILSFLKGIVFKKQIHSMTNTAGVHSDLFTSPVYPSPSCCSYWVLMVYRHPPPEDCPGLIDGSLPRDAWEVLPGPLEFGPWQMPDAQGITARLLASVVQFMLLRTSWD